MCRLTSDVGVKMSELPLAPPMAAALLNAARSGCSEEVAAVAALTSVRSIWAGSRSKAAKEARTKFAVAEGVHFPQLLHIIFSVSLTFT